MGIDNMEKNSLQMKILILTGIIIILSFIIRSLPILSNWYLGYDIWENYLLTLNIMNNHRWVATLIPDNNEMFWWSPYHFFPVLAISYSFIFFITGIEFTFRNVFLVFNFVTSILMVASLYFFTRRFTSNKVILMLALVATLLSSFFLQWTSQYVTSIIAVVFLFFGLGAFLYEKDKFPLMTILCFLLVLFGHRFNVIQFIVIIGVWNIIDPKMKNCLLLVLFNICLWAWFLYFNFQGVSWLYSDIKMYLALATLSSVISIIFSLLRVDGIITKLSRKTIETVEKININFYIIGFSVLALLAASYYGYTKYNYGLFELLGRSSSTVIFFILSAIGMVSIMKEFNNKNFLLLTSAIIVFLIIGIVGAYTEVGHRVLVELTMVLSIPFTFALIKMKSPLLIISILFLLLLSVSYSYYYFPSNWSPKYYPEELTTTDYIRTQLKPNALLFVDGDRQQVYQMSQKSVTVFNSINDIAPENLFSKKYTMNTYPIVYNSFTPYVVYDKYGIRNKLNITILDNQPWLDQVYKSSEISIYKVNN